MTILRFVVSLCETGTLREPLHPFAAAREADVDGNAVAHALGDDAEVFVERLAALEPARVGTCETWHQVDIDRVDPQPARGIPPDVRGDMRIHRVRLEMQIGRASCRERV